MFLLLLTSFAPFYCMYFIRSLYFFPAISENFSIFLFILEISIFLSLNTQPIGGDNMSTKTILSLCNGEYNFMEQSISKNSKYKEHLSKCVSFEDELQKLVDKSTFSIIEKAMEEHSIMSSIEIEQAFVEAFLWLYLYC